MTQRVPRRFAPARLRLFSAALLLAALGFVAARPVGPLPPLGPFLDPAQGFWALARIASPPARREVGLPGLGAPVRVLIDDRGVPHVFAASEEDAWRAQGYLVARDRLFQMELQTRATAGTLSELLGARALGVDRGDRQRGFPWAAERSLARLDSSALIARAARAYAEGVNAWIEQLDRAEVPFEYRLFSARPARWRPLDTYYLFLQMSATLAWQDETALKREIRALVGAAAADALFPRNSPIQEPIQPNGLSAPRYDFAARIPPPGLPDSSVLLAGTRDDPGQLVAERAPGGDAVGSNNWVVAARRTAAGYPLLAGDPHLELSLPSVWYEIHLHVAGGLDVAGATFPGTPGVVIGFNREVAWSFTNTGADVRDHYLETVDDDASPTRYRLDGVWRPLELRLEVVRGRRGEILATDTVRFTHRGPLARETAGWVSTRWTPFEAQNPGEDFLRLDRARSVTEWLDGWKDFVAAAQNGVVADRRGSVAIRSTGKFPIRPAEGRGDALRDGSTSASDWIGYLPLAAYPFALDPAQGYLASANQQPVDPRSNPSYLGVNWPSPWRAMRINQLLRADSAVTPDAMRRYQTDARSSRAEAIVPVLLAAARSREAAGIGDEVLQQAAVLLAEWDHSYTADNRRAVLFEATMNALVPLLWDELIHPERRGEELPRPLAVPAEAVLLQLFTDSASGWWDNRDTREIERRDAILAEALRLGLTRTLREHGPPEGDGWRWDRVHQANLYHLLRIPGLSALGLPVQGGSSTLSPSPGNGTHGASWRMVVELGSEVRAWTIYPGGQSGNPASAWYLDRLPRWLAGTLDTVLFPARPEDLPAARIRAELLLNPESR